MSLYKELSVAQHYLQHTKPQAAAIPYSDTSQTLSNQRSRNSYCIRVYTIPNIVGTPLTTDTSVCMCLVQSVYYAWNLPVIALLIE